MHQLVWHINYIPEVSSVHASTSVYTCSSKVAYFCVHFLILTVHGDGLDHYGREFYVGLFRNYDGLTRSARLIVRSASSTNTSFKVEALNMTYTGSVTATNPVIIDISNDIVAIDNSYTHRNKGIHVSSTGSEDISILVVNYQPGTIGDYLAYPCNNLVLDRYEYFAVSTYTSGLLSLILLVGCKDATTVTISPLLSIYCNLFQCPNT